MASKSNKPFPRDVKLIIWDLDGTLYPKDNDFVKAIVLAIRDVISISVREWGLPRDVGKSGVVFSALKSVFVKNLDFSSLIEKYHLQKDGQPLTSEELKDRFKECLADRIKLVSPELAEAMDNGVRQVVLTHSKTGFAQQLLERFGLLNFINKEEVFGIDKVEHRKNKAGGEAYLYVLDALGLTEADASNVIIAEDQQKNLDAAKTLGMHTVQISPEGILPAILRMKYKSKIAPDGIYRSPTEFLKDFNKSRGHERADARPSFAR